MLSRLHDWERLVLQFCVGNILRPDQISLLSKKKKKKKKDRITCAQLCDGEWQTTAHDTEI